VTRVKICGLRTPEDAEAAVEAGADALGVVLAPSERHISFAEVTSIRRAVPPLVPLVGVFVDPSQMEVWAALNAGVDVLQFCGAEEAEFCAFFARPFVKVVHVGGAAPSVDAAVRRAGGLVMFDTADPARRGGTGRPFPWSALEHLRGTERFALAGGLRAENVGEAIRRLRPFAVDVSSGVERDGRKDPELMRAFVRAVRESDAAA